MDCGETNPTRRSSAEQTVKFTDRYKALGIPYPKYGEACLGQCEGTGVVPVSARDTSEPWHTLWHEAEAKEHSEDGWHFVTCPDCGGTGKRKPER